MEDRVGRELADFRPGSLVQSPNHGRQVNVVVLNFSPNHPEHLVATHVHDNDGKSNQHLVPFEGRINWDAALMTMQKVGYDGTYLMELANTGSTADVLRKGQAARARFEKLMAY